MCCGRRGLGASAVLRGDLRRRRAAPACWSRLLWRHSGERAWRCTCGVVSAAGPEDGRYRALRDRWGAGSCNGSGCSSSRQDSSRCSASHSSSPQANPVTRAGCARSGGRHLDGERRRRGSRRPPAGGFRADPANRGRTCRAGLWRYSRHPNYFFEWLHWFTYVAIASGARLGPGRSRVPVVMFVFLRWVSGIPFTEAQALRTPRGGLPRLPAQHLHSVPWPPAAAGRRIHNEVKSMKANAMSHCPTELRSDERRPGLSGLAERGLLPDALLRLGMRAAVCAAPADGGRGGLAAQAGRFEDRLASLRAQPPWPSTPMPPTPSTTNCRRCSSSTAWGRT